MEDIYVAVVCSSNMNRSMEAHSFLAKKGWKVKSFGTGTKVKLPGLTVDTPNCYKFGVPYEYIYNDLVEKNKPYYKRIGLLQMLDRNRKIKLCPEKFQESTERFHVIITCEERVYDQVIEWFGSRRSVHNQPVHIINVEILDNHMEATIGAFMIRDMVTKMAQAGDLDDEIDELLHAFEAKYNRQMLNCVMFY